MKTPRRQHGLRRAVDAITGGDDGGHVHDALLADILAWVAGRYSVPSDWPASRARAVASAAASLLYGCALAPILAEGTTDPRRLEIAQLRAAWARIATAVEATPDPTISETPLPPELLRCPGLPPAWRRFAAAADELLVAAAADEPEDWADATFA